MTTRTITLVIDEQNRVQILTGGEIAPHEGRGFCQLAAYEFDGLVRRGAIAPTVEETDSSLTPASPLA